MKHAYYPPWEKNHPVTHSNGKSLDIKTSRLNPSANASVQDIYIYCIAYIIYIYDYIIYMIILYIYDYIIYIYMIILYIYDYIIYIYDYIIYMYVIIYVVNCDFICVWYYLLSTELCIDDNNGSFVYVVHIGIPTAPFGFASARARTSPPSVLRPRPRRSDRSISGTKHGTSGESQNSWQMDINLKNMYL